MTAVLDSVATDVGSVATEATVVQTTETSEFTLNVPTALLSDQTSLDELKADVESAGCPDPAIATCTATVSTSRRMLAWRWLADATSPGHGAARQLQSAAVGLTIERTVTGLVTTTSLAMAVPDSLASYAVASSQSVSVTASTTVALTATVTVVQQPAGAVSDAFPASTADLSAAVGSAIAASLSLDAAAVLTAIATVLPPFPPPPNLPPPPLPPTLPPSPSPPTAEVQAAAEQAAETEAAAAATANAANELASVLSTVTELNPAAAQQVVSALSGLFDAQASSQGSPSSGQAAASIAAAVDQMATAAAASMQLGPNGTAPAPVVLNSANINMTITLRPAASAAEEPVTCESPSGEPISVNMPADVFVGVGIDLSQPVAAVLSTSAVNLHAAPTATGSSSSGRRLDESSSSVASNTSTSATVSFSLRSGNTPLKINGAQSPINISLPYIAQPGNATTVECRFWNTTDGIWSTNGCTTTITSDGAVGCSCTHLTEFIAFEFPTSADDLLATALSSTSMNSLSLEAVQCALDPARSWRTIPAVWGCIFVLLFLFVALLTNAIYHDRIEIRTTLAMNIEKRREEAQRKEARRLKRQSTFVARRSKRSGASCSLRTHRNNSKVAPAVVEAESERSGACDTPPPSPPESPKQGSSPTYDIVQCCMTTSVVTTTATTELTLAQPAPVSRSSSSWVDSVSDVVNVVESATGLDMDGDGDVGVSQSSSAAANAAGLLMRPPNSEAGSTRALNAWSKAKVATKVEAKAAVFASKWHKDVDRVWKRLGLECIRNHTLCAGITTRGSPGYTRAQTVMILINGFAFELIMLCLFYPAPQPPPEEGEEAGAAMTINIVGILIGSTFCALIVIPTMLVFAWVYEPMIFLRMGRWMLRVIFCWPAWLYQCCTGRSAKLSDAEVVDSTVEHAVHSRSRTDVGEAATPRNVSPPPSLPERAAIEAPAAPPAEERTFSYESLDQMMLKASLTYSWDASDWPQVRLILFGWIANHFLFALMLCSFLLYGCELFEPREEPFEQESRLRRLARSGGGGGGGGGTTGNANVGAGGRVEGGAGAGASVAGNTDELILSWAMSAAQRFILHEPTLILAGKGLPILFASAFCANCCGETIVNSLSLMFKIVLASIKEIKG